MFTFASALACVLGGKHKDGLVHPFPLRALSFATLIDAPSALLVISSFQFVYASQAPLSLSPICMNAFIRLLINSRWAFSSYCLQHTCILTPSLSFSDLDLQIAGLIFIDTIVKTILGRDVRILQNHKFLAGSLGLGSGVMVNKSSSSLFTLIITAQLGAREHRGQEDEVGRRNLWTKTLMRLQLQSGKGVLTNRRAGDMTRVDSGQASVNEQAQKGRRTCLFSESESPGRLSICVWSSHGCCSCPHKTGAQGYQQTKDIHSQYTR